MTQKRLKKNDIDRLENTSIATIIGDSGGDVAEGCPPPDPSPVDTSELCGGGPTACGGGSTACGGGPTACGSGYTIDIEAAEYR